MCVCSPVACLSGLKSGSSQWTLLGLDLWTGADRADLTYYDDNMARNFMVLLPLLPADGGLGASLLTVLFHLCLLHRLPVCCGQANPFFAGVEVRGSRQGLDETPADAARRQCQLDQD